MRHMINYTWKYLISLQSTFNIKYFQRTDMKIINIYLTQEQKSKLNSICYKYQVSISTIAENLLFLFTKYQLRKEEDYKKIGKEYIYEDVKGSKTSIKPRGILTGGLYENMTKAYTNVVNIYLRKDIEKYIGKEQLQDFYNDLNKKLQTTNEPNWNYNQFRRQMAYYERKKKNENNRQNQIQN